MLLLVGLFSVAIHLVHPPDVPDRLDNLSQYVNAAVSTHVALMLTTPLMLMGLAGLYLRHAGNLKWWGWVSFIIMFSYFTLEIIHSVLQVYQYPILFENIQTEEQLKTASDIANRTLFHDGFPTTLSSVAMPLGMIGFIVMTVSLYRASVYRKWPALLFLLMPISFFLPWDSIGKYVFPASFLVYAWYGASMAFEKRYNPVYNSGQVLQS
jgi:hypothetical protein